jgi:hypothetical protein
VQQGMSINIKKTILLLLTLPSFGFWLTFCGLGILNHSDSLFELESRYFPLGLLSWIGFPTLIVGMFSIIRYPSITKIEAGIICVGIFNMLSAMYIGPIGPFIGVTNSPLGLTTAIILVLVGAYLVNGARNKGFNHGRDKVSRPLA